MTLNVQPLSGSSAQSAGKELEYQNVVKGFRLAKNLEAICAKWEEGRVQLLYTIQKAVRQIFKEKTEEMVDCHCDAFEKRVRGKLDQALKVDLKKTIVKAGLKGRDLDQDDFSCMFYTGGQYAVDWVQLAQDSKAQIPAAIVDRLSSLLKGSVVLDALKKVSQSDELGKSLSFVDKEGNYNSKYCVVNLDTEEKVMITPLGMVKILSTMGILSK